MVTKVAGIKGYVVLTTKFQKEGRRWTAYCEELGTATFGRSLPEAKERLKEAITLHLDTLDDVGECDRFLKEHNIVFHSTKPHKKIKISTLLSEDVYIQSYVQPITQPNCELVCV